MKNDVSALRSGAIKLVVREGGAELSAELAALPSNKMAKIVPSGKTSAEQPSRDWSRSAANWLLRSAHHLSRQSETAESHFNGRTKKKSHLRIIGKFLVRAVSGGAHRSKKRSES